MSFRYRNFVTSSIMTSMLSCMAIYMVRCDNYTTWYYRSRPHFRDIRTKISNCLNHFLTKIFEIRIISASFCFLNGENSLKFGLLVLILVFVKFLSRLLSIIFLFFSSEPSKKYLRYKDNSLCHLIRLNESFVMNKVLASYVLR